MRRQQRGGAARKDVDFALTQVPADQRKHWIPIAAVLLGFTFLATTMAAASELGNAFTAVELVLILLAGSLILSFYVGGLGWIAAKTGLNSILLSRYALGQLGGKWADVVLGGTQVFWYAVQSAYMGIVFTQSLGIEEYYVPVTVFFSLFFGAFAIWGTKGMEIVAYLSMPAFLYLAYKIPELSISAAGGLEPIFASEPTERSFTFVGAITIIVGTFISGGTNSTNWSRFARSTRTGFWASFSTFFIGTLVMAGAGMIGGVALRQGDMVEVMVELGIVTMAIVILIFNIWTTNTATAYSFGVAGAEFFNRSNKVPFVVGGLIVATVMAASGIYSIFLGFLTALAIFVPPLGGLIIGDYLYTWRRKFPRVENVKFRMVRYANLIAYALAILAAYVSSVYAIGVPSINGAVLAIVLVPVVNMLFKKLGIDDQHVVVDPEPEAAR